MSASQPLPPDQEAQAQELLLRLRERSEDELLALARLLVSKEDHELFGDTELQAREIVHRIGATAYQTHLEQKKTATRDPESNAPSVDNVQSSTDTGAKR